MLYSTQILIVSDHVFCLIIRISAFQTDHSRKYSLDYRFQTTAYQTGRKFDKMVPPIKIPVHFFVLFSSIEMHFALKYMLYLQRKPLLCALAFGEFTRVPSGWGSGPLIRPTRRATRYYP